MTQANNTNWMQQALKEARKAEQIGEVPVGAVVVAADGVTLLAADHNRTRSNHDPSGHAEILALRQAARNIGAARLNGVTLYATLEPCPMCAGAIIQARIARLIFGAYDPQYGAIVHGVRLFDQPNINHRPESIGGIAETECQALLQNFFAHRR